MYPDLKDKVALVTGAGKRTGIGYAICAKLAACGTHVIVADLGQTGGENGGVKTATRDEMEDIAGELEKDFGISSLAVDLDVTDARSVSRMLTSIGKRFDRVDILCNNAGATFGVPNTVHNYDESAWLKTVDVNLHGAFRVSKAVVPLMTEKGGTIINTASKAGKTPPLFNGAYAVAKAGVIMLTKVMALELAGMGIRVNAVCPAQIMTDLEKWRFGLEAEFFSSTIEEREQEMCKTIPMGRIGQPGEVGDLVAFLASAQSSYLTGQAVNICGGQMMAL